jgi:predicted phosphodiesterase
LFKCNVDRALCIFVCLFSAPAFSQNFTHDVTGDARPWNDNVILDDAEDFTFVIHSDLTGGERPGVFATAAAQMALLRPAFVISVGDLIEGSAPREELIAEWESFDERAKTIEAPVFYVGGNHDVSSEIERKLWTERYGPIHYHFRYRDVLFLVLDSEDLTPERRDELARLRQDALEVNRTQGVEAARQTPYALSPERNSGAIGEKQADYFVDVIEKNSDVRHTFLFVHKPVWNDETSHYTGIEVALADRTYTAFNGHTHTFQYRQRNERDHIQLATTGGAQFPEIGFSEDHVMLVSVRGVKVTMANLLLEGIRDKTMAYPGGQASNCFAITRCGKGR